MALKSMPSSRARDAPMFRGRKVRRFIDEYEEKAAECGLSDEQKCREVTRYVGPKEELVIESMPEFSGKDWNALKDAIIEMYKSEDVEQAYQLSDIEAYVGRNRWINSPQSLGRYVRHFRLITNYLIKKKIITERARDDLFYRGMKPEGLRKEVGDMAKRTNAWTDLNSPPPLSVIQKNAESLLQEDRYEFSTASWAKMPAGEHVDEDGDYGDGLDPVLNDPEGELYALDRSQLLRASYDMVPRAEGRVPAAKVPVVPIDTKPKVEVAVEELTKKMEQLMIMAHADRKANRSNEQNREAKRAQADRGPMVCYMCGEEGHGMTSCPETAQLRIAKVITTNAAGKLVRADGSPLPKAGPNGGGIAKVLKEEMRRTATTAVAEYDREERAEVLAGEVSNWAPIDIAGTTYEVFPAIRGGDDDKQKPYTKPQWESVIRTRAQRAKIREGSPQQETAPATKPPAAILQRKKAPTPIVYDPPPPPGVPDTRPVPPGIIDMRPTTNDIPMKDGTKARPKGPPPPNARAPQPGDQQEIQIIPNQKKDKESSVPRKKYRFGSELQEGVNHDDLLDKVLDNPVTITYRELLSHFEMSKRMQSLTKSQRIPVESEREARSAEAMNVEVGFGDIAKTEGAATWLQAQTSASLNSRSAEQREENVDSGTAEEDSQERTTASCANVEVGEEYEIVSDGDTEDDALDYWDRLREMEWIAEHGTTFGEEERQVYELQRHTGFLAMSTLRVVGEIMDTAAEILLDIGSELNLISQRMVEELGIAVDPSGKTWTIRGINGNVTHLLGLCRNVRITIGGQEFIHHFFVNAVPMGDKDIVLGQPGIHKYATLIDYAPGQGVIVTMWENGDRVYGKSVVITIPAHKNERNVMKSEAFELMRMVDVACVTVTKQSREEDAVVDELDDKEEAAKFWSREAAEAAFVEWKEEDDYEEPEDDDDGLSDEEGDEEVPPLTRLSAAVMVEGPRPESLEDRGMKYEDGSALAEENDNDDYADLPDLVDGPSFPSILRDAFEIGEGSVDKFGPTSADIDLVNTDVNLPSGIRHALSRAWRASPHSQKGNLANRVYQIGLAKGYEDWEAAAFADTFQRDVMGGKYKPVAKKVNPVNAYDPNSYVPEYRPIEIGELDPLSPNPPPLDQVRYTERLSKERIDTIISNMAPGFCSEAETSLLVSVLMLHEKAIAFTDVERGTFNPDYFPDYVMRTMPHTPWQVKPIRLPLAKEEAVMKLLEEQRKGGKYELSSASYRSAFFAVEKKGGLLRIVHDLQPLNAVTVRDAGLPPRIDTIIEKLKGRAIYCIADLKAGYDAVRLAPESRDLTSFHAYGYGLMRLAVLPQGYTNAMQEFCRRTNHMIQPMIPNEALVFVDDVTGMGPRSRYNDEPIPENKNIRKFVWEFAHTLNRLLAHLEIAGVTVSGSKLVLATPMLDVLGTTVSLEGAHASKSTIGRILKWPECKDPSEVRQFLGTIGVLRRWIRGFSVLAKPLTELTMKTREKEFEWSKEAAESMQALKDSVAESPPLAELDYELASKVIPKEYRADDLGLVTIAVDSSFRGAGWVISQVKESGDLPIVFGSVTFKEHESRYSQAKLELYGLFRALRAERHLLHGIHFRIKLDARSVVDMINRPDLPNAPLNRWIAEIQTFDYEILYNPATKHKAADGLSRRRRTSDDSDDDDGSLDEDIDHLYIAVPKQLRESALAVLTNQEVDDTDPDMLIAQLDAKMDRSIGECLPLETTWNVGFGLHHVDGTMNCYVGMQEQPNKLQGEGGPENEVDEEEIGQHEHKRPDDDSEEFWRSLLAYLTKLELPEDKKEARRVKARAMHFFIYEDILWRRHKSHPPQQVVLTQSRRQRLIREAHDESGHRGREATFTKLRDSFWFPNMYEQVARYCRTCHECQMRSSQRNRIPIQVKYVRTILREFSIDTVFMPKGKYGFRYVVDMREHLSGFLEYKPLRTLTARAVADFIFEVMCRYGCMPKLICDNGSEFQGAVIELAEQYKVPLIPISPYNPQANGFVERGHGVYINSIWKVLQGHTSQWPDVIAYAVWADRITAKRTTGHSPAFMLYGQQPLLPFDLSDRSWHVLDWPGVKTTEDLLALRLQQLSQRSEYLGEASEKDRKARVKSAEYFERKHEKTISSGVYETGTMVLVWNSKLEFTMGSKGQLRWLGPYIIVQRRPKGSYIVSELDGTVMRSPVAARRIKPYQPRDGMDLIVGLTWQQRWKHWKGDVDDEPEEYEDEPEEEREVLAISSAQKKSKLNDGPGLPRPWELKGKDATRYWQKIAEDVRSGRMKERAERGEDPEWQKEIDRRKKERDEYENYNDDYRGMTLDQIPRYLTNPFGKGFRPVLFKWKDETGWLRGPPVFESASVQVGESNNQKDWIRLGKQTITIRPPASDTTTKVSDSDYGSPRHPKLLNILSRTPGHRLVRLPRIPSLWTSAEVGPGLIRNDVEEELLSIPRSELDDMQSTAAAMAETFNLELESVPLLDGLWDLRDYARKKSPYLDGWTFFPYESPSVMGLSTVHQVQKGLRGIIQDTHGNAVFQYDGGQQIFYRASTHSYAPSSCLDRHDLYRLHEVSRLGQEIFPALHHHRPSSPDLPQGYEPETQPDGAMARIRAGELDPTRPISDVQEWDKDRASVPALHPTSERLHFPRFPSDNPLDIDGAHTTIGATIQAHLDRTEGHCAILESKLQDAEAIIDKLEAGRDQYQYQYDRWRSSVHNMGEEADKILRDIGGSHSKHLAEIFENRVKYARERSDQLKDQTKVTYSDSLYSASEMVKMLRELLVEARAVRLENGDGDIAAFLFRLLFQVWDMMRMKRGMEDRRVQDLAIGMEAIVHSLDSLGFKVYPGNEDWTKRFYAFWRSFDPDIARYLPNTTLPTPPLTSDEEDSSDGSIDTRSAHSSDLSESLVPRLQPSEAFGQLVEYSDSDDEDEVVYDAKKVSTSSDPFGLGLSLGKFFTPSQTSAIIARLKGKSYEVGEAGPGPSTITQYLNHEFQKYDAEGDVHME